jgi:hypothetical protein
MEGIIQLKNIIEKYLERGYKEDKEISLTDCYLFFLFFLQRCQLVCNMLRLLNVEMNDLFAFSIKYCIMYENDFSKVIRKMYSFKREFDNEEIIVEILKFIKSTDVVQEKSTKLVGKFVAEHKTRLKVILNKFGSIKGMMDQYDQSLINDSDVFSCIEDSLVIQTKKEKVSREIVMIEEEWRMFDKNGNILYSILREWYKI